jgi:hypothetical protein
MYEPTVQKSFNLKEVTTIMMAVDSFRAIMKDEAFDKARMHASSLVLCNRCVYRACFPALSRLVKKTDTTDFDIVPC